MGESHGGETSRRHRESSGDVLPAAIPSQASLRRPKNEPLRQGRRSSVLRDPNGIVPADSDTSGVRRHAGETRDCPENVPPRPHEVSAEQAGSALPRPRKIEPSLDLPRSYHNPPGFLIAFVAAEIQAALPGVVPVVQQPEPFLTRFGSGRITVSIIGRFKVVVLIYIYGVFGESAGQFLQTATAIPSIRDLLNRFQIA